MSEDARGASLPGNALEVVLREYDALRKEISDRLKIAFSHVAYAGAIAAFALPSADNVHQATGLRPAVTVVIAVAAIAALAWVAVLNMLWIKHCARYVRSIEDKVNAHFGCEVLGWEKYATHAQRRYFLLLPGDPDRKP